MTGKQIDKVVLSPQHKEILDKICAKLGQSQSETLRIALLDYAKDISLITEKSAHPIDFMGVFIIGRNHSFSAVYRDLK